MYTDTIVTAGTLIKSKVNSDIITGTLDTLNSGMYYHPAGAKTAQSASYDFQKDVLSAYYTERGLGAIVTASA
jgi:hypothetical protein